MRITDGLLRALLPIAGGEDPPPSEPPQGDPPPGEPPQGEPPPTPGAPQPQFVPLDDFKKLEATISGQTELIQNLAGGKSVSVISAPPVLEQILRM